MATDCIPQLTFTCYPRTKAVARFDQTQASTDGVVVLLKALDDCLQLTDKLAACLPDRRDPDKVRHAVRDLLRQRIFGLACGYEDGNDAARLIDDPLHKLAVGRDPVTGGALASQPTGAVPDGADVGVDGDRTASPPAQGPRAAHHD